MRDIKVRFKLKSLSYLPKSSITSSKISKKESLFKISKIANKLPARERGKLNKGVLLVVSIVILLGITLGLLSGKVIKNTYQKVILAQLGIEKIYSLTQSNNSDIDLKQINDELLLSKKNLEVANSSLNEIVFLKGIPLIGSAVNTVDHLVKSGLYTVSALNRLVQGGQTTFYIFDKSLAKSFEKISASDSKNLLLSFLKIKPTIDQSVNELQKAEKEMAQISFFMKFGKIKKISDEFDKNIPEIRIALCDLSKIMDKLPEILGFNGQKEYFLLFLNNNEMRAIGGFPGSLAVLKMKGGQLSSFKIENLYKFVEEYTVSFDGLSQFSADIPTFASKIIKKFQESNSFDQTDGIILVDTEILKEILKITGPILVENKDYDYSYFLNDSNVIDIIERHTKATWRQFGESKLERKEILNLLLEEILNKIPQLGEADMPKFITALERLAKQKHLMFYLKDPELEALAKKYNTAGEIKDTDGDYCLVVDNDFAYNKSHQALEKKINYKVNIETKAAKLSLDYFLNHPRIWKIWEIISFTKIYLPAGTQIKEFIGFDTDVPANDQKYKEYEGYTESLREGKEIFSNWIKVFPLESKHFELSYQLPAHIFNKRQYTLLFQKQQGTLHTDLEVEINVGDQKVKKIEPKGYIKDGNVIRWETDLLQDREFKIIF